MASDWQAVTTNFVEPGNGGAFTGFLFVAMLVPKVQLAGGAILQDFNYKFTVTNGVALQSDGGTMMLPITEDSNPADVPLFFKLMDANGRQADIGYAVFPRPADADPYPAVLLEDHLTV